MSEEIKTKRKKTGGRRAGTLNKTTKIVKEAILEAFEEVGGVDYLALMATEEPKAFLSLLGKVLPLQVNHADNDGDKLFPNGFAVKILSNDSDSAGN